MKTYDVHFNDESNSNCKGFKGTKDFCIGYINYMNDGNHSSHFADYKGGTVSVICNETGESVFETAII